MKKYFLILLALPFIVFLFSFKTYFSSSENITNYYYFQGQKWFFSPKTDLVFVKFKDEVNLDNAKNSLLEFPEINAIGLNDLEKVNFVPLKTKLNEDSYNSLIERMNSKDEIEAAGFAYTPLNYDDGKTFYGMSNEFAVQFKENTTIEQINNINSNNKVDIINQMDLSGGPTFILKVKDDADFNAIDMANKYYEDGLVNYAEPDFYCTNTLCDTTNDTYFYYQWSIRNLGNNVPTNPPNVIADCDMDVDSAWMVTKGDSTIKIAVIDTGVDTVHPDLVGNMTHGLGWDCVDNDPWPQPVGDGHGTSCAGIAAGFGDNALGVAGIAYKCKIIPIRCIGGISAYHGYACGFIRAWQYGADVISNSWGQVGGASSLLYNAISDAARFGRNGKGCVILVASGNENGVMRFPASIHPDIIVVGGLAPCNKRKSPTDGCSNETWGASYGTTLDVVAPCVKIYTTTLGGGYTSGFNGTSSATPNTAGVCGLLLSANPNMTRKDVEAYLSLSAEKVGAYNYDSVKQYGNWNNEMGYGRVNARLALALVLSGIDKVSPYIYHDNPLYSSIDSLTRVATAIIKDNRKLATGTNSPKLYYRVGTGTFNPVSAFSVVGDTFKFNIPGQTQGSVIEYYFAAQDTVNPPNIATLPAGGSGINPPGSSPPLTRFTYIIGKFKVGLSTTTPKLCPNSSTIYDTITIAGTPPPHYILDVNVKLNISHRTDSDVDVFLKKNTTQSELTTDNGGSGDSYVDTYFDDEAALFITSGNAPFTNRYKPETPLTIFDGQPVDGQWILQFTDDATGNYGTLDSWMIEITYANFIGVTQTITIPSKYALYQNFPNPFNPVSKIKFDIPKISNVEIKVFDLLGREVTTLVNEVKHPGVYDIEFNGTNLASGIYIYRMKTADFTDVKRMVILK